MICLDTNAVIYILNEEASPGTAVGLLAFTRVLWSDERYVLSVASGRHGAIVEVRWFDADSASSASSS